MRFRSAVVMIVVLGGCSSTDSSLPPVYTPPSPPTRAALIAGLSTAAWEEKVKPPLEISALRKTEYGGFGSHFVCMREATPTAERHFVYAVFYDNEQYKGVRQSVIIEHCEAEMFTSIDVPAPKQPTPSP